VTVLFDTATLQPADRPDSWNDAHRRIFLPIGVRFTEADTLSGRIEQQELGPVRAFRIFSEPGAHRQPAPGLATACGRPYSPPQGSSERRA